MTDGPAEIIFADAWASLSGARRPFIIGISGAQGSGKSTIARRLAAAFGGRRQRTVILSLDDLYLDRDARLRLANDAHSLFATRGVPGTHDVALGVQILSALRGRRSAIMPGFDKGLDALAPEREWARVDVPVDAVIFEGWCLGAAPAPEADLVEPVNELERMEDADGAWRHAVNNALAGSYQTLFGLIDRLYFLRAPSFEIVRQWRGEQERKLADTAPSDRRAYVMSEREIARFIAHYERITRHMMKELPNRAHMTLQLDNARNVTAVMRRTT